MMYFTVNSRAGIMERGKVLEYLTIFGAAARAS